jgi:hypothetical protein
MEDLENAGLSSAASAAKGFDHDKKEQVVESSETQIITTPGSSSARLSERIAKRLEAWSVESRGTVLFLVFLKT